MLYVIYGHTRGGTSFVFYATTSNGCFQVFWELCKLSDDVIWKAISNEAVEMVLKALTS